MLVSALWGFGLVVGAVSGVISPFAAGSGDYCGLPWFFVQVIAPLWPSVFQPLMGIRDMAGRALDGDTRTQGRSFNW